MDSGPFARYRFRGWLLDGQRASLSCRGSEVRLRPKAFDVLSFLVQHPGRVVSKRELLAAVWPDAFVTEDSLVQCLVEIRRALGDDASVIATVPKRGYRFDAEVVPLPADGVSAGSTEPADSRVTGRLPTLLWNGVRLRPASAAALLGLVSLALVIAGVRAFRVVNQPVTSPSEYVQLTDFTDSATAPVLSPDGRMVAFIRGGDWFLSRGQIYVKQLPDGEPRRLTADGDMKLGPVFTPDGTRVAYTRTGGSDWSTWTVPVVGGEPTRLLTNASGLVWLDSQRVMFSEFRPPSPHLGIVTTTEARTERQVIYFPAHERGMAHYAYASPDRRWVLVVEMNRTGAFDRCRVVPFDGSSAGRQVGPPGRCTSAAWSPRSEWMYFSAEVDGRSHLWRQAFPDGSPEQITFGPTDEQGVAVAPDGEWLITSIGRARSAIWIHDAGGDRPLSTEGFAFAPRWSRGGSRVYFMLRQAPDSSAAELRSIDLSSGAEASLLTGIHERHDAGGIRYDISPDERQVVYAAMDANGRSAVWLAPLDRSAPPRLLAHDADSPSFGPAGDVFFIDLGQTTSHISRMQIDGTGRRRITEGGPVVNRGDVSPDGKWLVVYAAAAAGNPLETVAVPVEGGGEPRRLCNALCWASWSDDGSLLYVRPYAPPARTFIVPLSPAEPAPDVGEAAFDDSSHLPAIPGMQVIERDAMPRADESTYVFVSSDEQRNLYRVPLH